MRQQCNEMFYFIHNWINKLVSEEHKVPRTQFDARRVAGSANYKQSKAVSSFNVSLFIQFIKSWKQVEFV